jgi:hypothetical protein
MDSSKVTTDGGYVAQGVGLGVSAVTSAIVGEAINNASRS